MAAGCDVSGAYRIASAFDVAASRSLLLDPLSTELQITIPIKDVIGDFNFNVINNHRVPKDLL